MPDGCLLVSGGHHGAICKPACEEK